MSRQKIPDNSDVLRAPSFTGTWVTETDGRTLRMKLEQENGIVTGTYAGPPNGTIEGKLDGKGRLIFSWSEGSSSGSGIFVLDAGSRNFSGHYSNGPDPQNVAAQWTGRKVPSAAGSVEPPPIEPQIPPADQNKSKSLRLTCRAGGKMKVKPAAGGSLRIEYRHAPRAAEKEDPLAGKCAAVDRPLEADEPTILVVPQLPRLNELKARIRKRGLFVATAQDLGDGTFVASRIDLPFEEDRTSEAGDTGDPDEGGNRSPQIACFSGHTLHTGGSRKGKTFNTELCIDWSAKTCKLVGKSIVRQSVSECTPGASITAKVFYKSGKSVIWDMALDGNELIGSWRQSDGASGEWITH